MNNVIFRAKALTRSHWRALKCSFRVIGVREARSRGATHEGTLCGLPIWGKDPHGYNPLVIAKWRPANFLVPVLHGLDQFFAWVTGDGEDASPLCVRRISR